MQFYERESDLLQFEQFISEPRERGVRFCCPVVVDRASEDSVPEPRLGQLDCVVFARMRTRKRVCSFCFYLLDFSFFSKGLKQHIQTQWIYKNDLSHK